MADQYDRDTRQQRSIPQSRLAPGVHTFVFRSRTYDILQIPGESPETDVEMQTRETAQAINGWKLQRAVKFLENVQEHKEAVPMRRYAGGTGRAAQGM